MPILFQDVLQQKFDEQVYPGRAACWQELVGLVAAHDAFHWPDQPPWPRYALVRGVRQLDKYEPALTYYLFAALNLASDNFANGGLLLPLFKKAFRSEIVAEQVFAHLSSSGWDGLAFESPASPSQEIVHAVQHAMENHPIAYVREFAQRVGVGYEGETIFDTFVGNENSLRNANRGSTGLGVEVKFTSDISHDTTYSPRRNQIIRNLEVGNSHFTNFFYLFLSPRQFREKESRFYVYKLQEYLGAGGPKALDRDSLTKPGESIISRWQKRIGWLDVEDIVEATFSHEAVENWHAEAGAFAEFLTARRLWPVPGQPV